MSRPMRDSVTDWRFWRGSPAGNGLQRKAVRLLIEPPGSACRDGCDSVDGTGAVRLGRDCRLYRAGQRGRGGPFGPTGVCSRWVVGETSGAGTAGSRIAARDAVPATG